MNPTQSIHLSLRSLPLHCRPAGLDVCVFRFKSMNSVVAALQVEFTRSYLRARRRLTVSLCVVSLAKHIEGEVHL